MHIAPRGQVQAGVNMRAKAPQFGACGYLFNIAPAPWLHHARASEAFRVGARPVMGEGPPLGGPQLPGGNLLVYPPDPSCRAGKLLHNRAKSELRSLLVGPPTTTTAKT